MIKTTVEILKTFLNNVTFQHHGDGLERKYYQYIAELFHNCEAFWRIFVVPLTHRMDSFPHKIDQNIDFQSSVNDQLERIASLYYSMFANLVFAHLHISNPIPSSLNNFYTHLGTSCDLAENILVYWHLLMLKCREEESPLLQKLTKDKFLEEVAGPWYEKNYSKIFSYYTEKGKSFPIYLPSRADLLKEYFGGTQDQEDYLDHSRKIRVFRNALVHDIQIGQLEDQEKQIWLPKLGMIQNYRTWRQVREVRNKPIIIKRDFIRVEDHMQLSLSDLESKLNSLWSRLIEDFESEFFSVDRSSLRNLFFVELVESPQDIITETKSDDSFQWSTQSLSSQITSINIKSGSYPRIDTEDFQETSGSGVFNFPDGEGLP